MQINQSPIGQGHPLYIIAELSANHGQDFETAMQLVDAAAEAGANAIKLQTYTPDTMTLDSDLPWFCIQGTLWDQQRLYDLYQQAYTPWEWHAPLQKRCREKGLDFFSSPFDASAVDFLENLAVPAYKIASFELVDLPLIRKAAETGKPLIISTGMGTLDEIEAAVKTARKYGSGQVALLKCNSSYPAPPEEMHLQDIHYLQTRFDLPVGLSDHTLGPEIALAATALGANILEKHLTLSRQNPTADAAFSMEPAEFKALVQALRNVEKAIGAPRIPMPTVAEQASRALRRSLFVVQDLPIGTLLRQEHIRALRPGLGLPPGDWESVLGRRLKTAVVSGTPLSWDLLET
jgi:pseudaminic acid synthase